jgi:predicted metal-dependent hydrolase
MAAITASTPERTVRTRRIEFEYPTEDLPRHYVSVRGEPDLIMSHVVTTLSSVFPEGEDFFVRSVRNYRDRITDPELKKQVGGFIGQEAIHGREHRTFNERLGELGYPTHTTDRMVAFGLGVGEKVLPKSVQLAITSALEHYTATLAEVLLTDPEAQAMLEVDEVRSLFLWHALEESEHKAVAFDVYQAVSGNHWIRVGTMNAVTFGFFLSVIGHTIHSLLLDPEARRHPVRVWRSFKQLRHSPWLRKDVRRRIRDYNRRGFHPDDHDSTALVEEWRARLFGDEGALVERLKSA